MLVRLAELESKIRKPSLELLGQPWTCGKAANEKYELLMVNLEQCSRSQSTRTELTRRRCLKLSMTESTIDWIEGSKNLETCALGAGKFGYKVVDKLGKLTRSTSTSRT